MAQIDNSRELRSILQERDDWHVWVIEFGITHSLMRLALHPATYPRSIKVEFMDCVRLEGDLQGGPYPLQLQPVDWHGSTLWELRSTTGSFRLVYGSISHISRSD